MNSTKSDNWKEKEPKHRKAEDTPPKRPDSAGTGCKTVQLTSDENESAWYNSCHWRNESYVFGSNPGEDTDGNVEEMITKIDKTEDENTGYWYNSDDWRDKSCVFGIFDVLPEESKATPREVRSGPKLASNKRKRQQKKKDRYRDDGNRYIEKAKNSRNDKELKNEDQNTLQLDVKEEQRSVREAEP